MDRILLSCWEQMLTVRSNAGSTQIGRIPSGDAAALQFVAFLNLWLCTPPAFQSQRLHSCMSFGLKSEISWSGTWSELQEPSEGWRAQAPRREGRWWQRPSQGIFSLQSQEISPKGQERGKNVNNIHYQDILEKKMNNKNIYSKRVILGSLKEWQFTVFHKVHDSIYCISCKCCLHSMAAQVANTQLKQSWNKSRQWAFDNKGL